LEKNENSICINLFLLESENCLSSDEVSEREYRKERRVQNGKFRRLPTTTTTTTSIDRRCLDDRDTDLLRSR